MPYKKFEHTNDVATRFLLAADLLKKADKDFWENIQISPSYLSQIRAGNRQPTIDHLVKLVVIYKFSGTWLLSGTGEMRDEPESISLDVRLAGIEQQISKIASSLKIDKSRGHNSGHKNGK